MRSFTVTTELDEIIELQYRETHDVGYDPRNEELLREVSEVKTKTFADEDEARFWYAGQENVSDGELFRVTKIAW